jgi:hypothetical protein
MHHRNSQVPTHILLKPNLQPWQGIMRCKNQTQVRICQMYPFDFICDTSSGKAQASNKFETSLQLHTDWSTCTEALCYKTIRELSRKFAHSRVSQTRMRLQGISSSSLQPFCEEGMPQRLLCCQAVCWIILQQPLQKVDEIPS